jgi:hypothetical protein
VSSFGSSKRPSSDIGFIGDLIETIAHELAHARFPELPHGDEFNRRVRQILNGKRFPWVILVLSKNDKSQATGEREEEKENH